VGVRSSIPYSTNRHTAFYLCQLGMVALGVGQSHQPDPHSKPLADSISNSVVLLGQ